MRYQVHSRGKKKVIIISCLPTGSKLSEREEEEKKIRYFFFSLALALAFLLVYVLLVEILFHLLSLS
jgi:hypothetical protein